MTKQQEVQSVGMQVSLYVEISPVLRNKVRWEQMGEELSLDRKTTDTFVQKSQECEGVLYTCHSVRGFCISCIPRAQAQGQEGFVLKNVNSARQRQHHPSRVTTKPPR